MGTYIKDGEIIVSRHVKAHSKSDYNLHLSYSKVSTVSRTLSCARPMNKFQNHHRLDFIHFPQNCHLQNSSYHCNSFSCFSKMTFTFLICCVLCCATPSRSVLIRDISDIGLCADTNDFWHLSINKMVSMHFTFERYRGIEVLHILPTPSNHTLIVLSLRGFCST